MIDALSDIVSTAIYFCETICCLGVPLLIWEAVFLLTKVVVRILFGVKGKSSDSGGDSNR